MTGLFLCALAFVAALVCAWRSLVAGLAAVLSAGYLFGIARANTPDTYSHFIFDSAVIGFYVSYFSAGGLKDVLDPNLRGMQRWASLLIGWAIVMALVPVQHLLIQLVGLRGNCFLVPFLLVGSNMDRRATNSLALCLSILNVVAFAFAVAEYVLGVPTFYPENNVTELIYRSRDVAGGTLRIPATFANAHSYGTMMAITLPWLLGAWGQPGTAKWKSMLLVLGMACAMAGVFLCAARTPVIMLGLLVVMTTFSGKLRGGTWIVWGVLIAGLAYIISGEERMQRFLTMDNTDQVVGRLQVSVNMTFLELMVIYPFGNGMGAGGTSIPYFLQDLVKDPVLMENEYSRILLEQGIVGLVLWLTFVVWFMGQRPVNERDPWLFGKQLLWFFSLASFAMAIIGTGLMTTIPTSMVFFLGIGVAAAPFRMQKPRTVAVERSGPALAAIGTA
jgi:hypothetical protein